MLQNCKNFIERAIKRATGELETEKLEEISFEAIGPGGIALIIEGITNNKNRTINELRHILNRFNSKLVQEGGVKWMFERKGCITVDLKNQDQSLKKDDLELIAIEAGDIVLVKDDPRDVATSIKLSQKTLQKIKQNLFWAFFYNMLTVPLAAGILYPAFQVLVRPEIAAATMILSDITVVGNSMLLKRWKP